MFWIIVHLKDSYGALLYKAHSSMEKRALPLYLDLELSTVADVVITNNYLMFQEYAPFTRIFERKEFVRQCLVYAEGVEVTDELPRSPHAEGIAHG